MKVCRSCDFLQLHVGQLLGTLEDAFESELEEEFTQLDNVLMAPLRQRFAFGSVAGVASLPQGLDSNRC